MTLLAPSLVRGRLAPSPTGPLHVGHARSFLVAWWSVRKQGGLLTLRQEDLDDARASVHHADQVRRDLEWLGIDWDCELLQSSRMEQILRLAEQLVERGLAYPCVCSRGDIRGLLSAPHAGEAIPRYSGTCRGRYHSVAEAEGRSGKPAGIRFVAPDRDVRFVDGVAGVCTQNPARDVGDFLIVRRDKRPAYQLAVVHDDGFDRISEVVRGNDLLDSTPRQLTLLEALQLPAPRYYHLPLVLDAAGERLAKRSDALSLASLRQRGIDPRAVVGWVARSCGMPSAELITAREALRHFTWQHLAHHPVRVAADAWSAPRGS